MNTKGYSGGVLVGNFIYFSPLYDGVSFSGKVLQYDTTMSFFSPSSWTAYDAGNSGMLTNTIGYSDVVNVEQYIFFIPEDDGISFHAKVLRYDTTLPFTSPSSWKSYDAGNSGGLIDTKGYFSGAVCGSAIYFSPYNNTKVLRFEY